jgi:hypothetical protein
MNRDIAVSIMIRLWRSTVGFQYPAGQVFSLRHNFRAGFGAHPASYPMGARVPTLGWSSRGMKLTTHRLVTECLELYLQSLEPGTTSCPPLPLMEYLF